jgi:hypothetical protein
MGLPAGACRAAPRGLGGEPQEGLASVAGGGPAGRPCAASANDWATRACPRTGSELERPDHVWALDYEFDVTATGRVDKDAACPRRIHPRVPGRSCRPLHRHGCQRGLPGQGRWPARSAPEFIRCENGPQLTTKALRDCCRFAGCGTSYIEPVALGEPLGRVLRQPHPRRVLAIEQFDTLLEPKSSSATGGPSTGSDARVQGRWAIGFGGRNGQQLSITSKRPYLTCWPTRTGWRTSWASLTE